MEDKKWEGKDIKVHFTVEGDDWGYGTISITEDGTYRTDSVENEFYKMLRGQEKQIRKEAEEEEKEFIIDNLTKEQEDKLKDIHFNQADGVLDDDMPDDYENWLCYEVDIDELKGYLKNK